MFDIRFEYPLVFHSDWVRTFLLIDGNVGIQSADHTAIEMLEEFGRPYAVSSLNLIYLAFLHRFMIISEALYDIHLCKGLSVFHSCMRRSHPLPDQLPGGGGHASVLNVNL